jgi:hypothetical protein
MNAQWNATKGNAPHFHSQIADEVTGATVAVVYDDPDGSKGALLAAAPDLLEALRDAEFLLRKAGQLAGPMQDSFNRSAADARAAIAKATA